MRSKSRLGLTFALVGAVAMWSCGGGGSTVGAGGATSTLTAPTAPSGSVRPRSEEEPAPEPTPDQPPVPTPAPTALTIKIVGSFGNTAFAPNPIQASVGDMIVWSNSDMRLHSIVLDDGSVVGDVAPGESSAPMLLKNAAATYYCTIHSTMVGSINGELAPAPPPSATEPPPGDYYGGYSRRPRRTR